MLKINPGLSLDDVNEQLANRWTNVVDSKEKEDWKRRAIKLEADIDSGKVKAPLLNISTNGPTEGSESTKLAGLYLNHSLPFQPKGQKSTYPQIRF